MDQVRKTKQAVQSGECSQECGHIPPHRHAPSNLHSLYDACELVAKSVESGSKSIDFLYDIMVLGSKKILRVNEYICHVQAPVCKHGMVIMV